LTPPSPSFFFLSSNEQAATTQNNVAASSQGAPRLAAAAVGQPKQTVYLTVLEVYNETVRDLLVDPHPRKGPPKVDLRVTKAGGVTTPGAMELEVGWMGGWMESWIVKGKQSKEKLPGKGDGRVEGRL
jgi:hypothetical protein